MAWYILLHLLMSTQVLSSAPTDVVNYFIILAWNKASYAKQCEK